MIIMSKHGSRQVFYINIKYFCLNSYGTDRIHLFTGSKSSILPKSQKMSISGLLPIEIPSFFSEKLYCPDIFVLEFRGESLMLFLSYHVHFCRDRFRHFGNLLPVGVKQARAGIQFFTQNLCHKEMLLKFASGQVYLMTFFLYISGSSYALPLQVGRLNLGLPTRAHSKNGH